VFILSIYNTFNDNVSSSHFTASKVTVIGE